MQVYIVPVTVLSFALNVPKVKSRFGKQTFQFNLICLRWKYYFNSIQLNVIKVVQILEINLSIKFNTVQFNSLCSSSWRSRSRSTTGPTRWTPPRPGRTQPSSSGENFNSNRPSIVVLFAFDFFNKFWRKLS